MSTNAIIFRGLDSTGDWQFGFGLSSYLTGQQEIATDIQTALQCLFGDAFWDATFGVDWLNLLGSVSSQNEIVLQTRKIILSRNGVVRINSVATSFNRQMRVLNITYNITTIYSQSVINSVNIPTG